MNPEAPVRVVVGKIGLDGHEVGARVVARGLVEQGMEVIYTGLRRTPAQIVATAVQEDCDVIGLSILSGAHIPLVRRVCDIMREEQLDDVLLVVGGVIPDDDVVLLTELGVDAVFHPATTIAEIGDFIRRRVRRAATTPADPGNAGRRSGPTLSA